ncbi:MAG: hypothetical protein EXR71_04890 [Myxococcales bacterium]|nr:hypothetical protein [Myxococcales bacterium]
MKSIVVLALFGAACEPSTTDKVGGVDTSEVSCDRIHGARGVLIIDDDVTHFPTEAPDTIVATTSVAGPLSDGGYVAIAGGELLTSADEGCNWDEPGSRLPGAGDWDLVAAGEVVYAVDRASSSTATSTDGTLSWTASDSGEPFLGEVAFDPAVPGRLRGVQARGAVTTEDFGATWTPNATPPPAALTAGAVYGGDLGVVVATHTGGVLLSNTGGTAWEEVGVQLFADGFIGYRIAFSTDSADTIWVAGIEDGDTTAIYRTIDGGGRWDDVMSSKGHDLDADAPLWMVPDKLNGAISAWGSTQDNYGINVYEITAGENVHTTHTSAYTNVHDVVVRDDGSLLVAVDGLK